jgi:ATP-dependent Lon protease
LPSCKVRAIREDVESALQQQREYIRVPDGTIRSSARRRLSGGRLPHQARRARVAAGSPRAGRAEVARLERMGEQTGESQMIRTYLDWPSQPWGKTSEERPTRRTHARCSTPTTRASRT